LVFCRPGPEPGSRSMARQGTPDLRLPVPALSRDPGRQRKRHLIFVVPETRRVIRDPLIFPQASCLGDRGIGSRLALRFGRDDKYGGCEPGCVGWPIISMSAAPSCRRRAGSTLARNSCGSTGVGRVFRAAILSFKPHAIAVFEGLPQSLSAPI